MPGGGATDRALAELSLKLDEFSSEFDQFNSVAFAANSNYPRGQRSLEGWTKELTDTLSEVLVTLELGIDKVITRTSLTADDRTTFSDAIDEYKRIQALHSTVRAAKKPPVGFSTDTVQVTIPNLNFAPLIARLGTEGRFQTTALV